MKIKSKELGKYEIHIDKDNYVVVENAGLNKKGETVLKTHYYCSNIESALKKCCLMQVNNSKNKMTLKEYLKEIKEVFNSIKELV